MKLNSVVKMERKEVPPVCMCDCIPCKTESCDKCDLGQYQGYRNGDLCNEGCSSEAVDAYNQAIDELDQWEFDVEALARICHRNSGRSRAFGPEYDSMGVTDKGVFIREAQAILQSMPTILVRKEK